MTRSLVLTNEAARHPFRQRLPRPQVEPIAPRDVRQDAQFFGQTFAATFVAVYGFML